MNKKKAGELLGKFWEACPDYEGIHADIYLTDLFIEYLYDEGLEICPREFRGIKSKGVDK